MERKIGEIFEYNGEWYQCVKDGCCNDCAFNGEVKCYNFTNDNDPVGTCSSLTRTDKHTVIFKKLEKVGEPYEFDGHLFQSYHTFEVPIFTENYATVREYGNNSKISIEIKQNKEDMKENNVTFIEKLNELCKKYNMSDGVRNDFMSEVKEIMNNVETVNAKKELNLKPFDINAAKSGKPVCTRDGRKARIVCFDKHCVENNAPIVACVISYNSNNQEFEDVIIYKEDGTLYEHEHPFDLMMLPERKEGWINIYNADTTFYYADGRVFETKDEAVQEAKEEVEKEQREKNEYIDTIRVEWEE